MSLTEGKTAGPMCPKTNNNTPRPSSPPPAPKPTEPIIESLQEILKGKPTGYKIYDKDGLLVLRVFDGTCFALSPRDCLGKIPCEDMKFLGKFGLVF